MLVAQFALGLELLEQHGLPSQAERSLSRDAAPSPTIGRVVRVKGETAEAVKVESAPGWPVWTTLVGPQAEHAQRLAERFGVDVPEVLDAALALAGREVATKGYGPLVEAALRV